MKRPFTLVELLVVIAVIGILMGLLLPAISHVKTKGKELKAKTDITSIVTAVKQFEADYGILPNPSGATANVSIDPTVAASASTNYKDLLQNLTCIQYKKTDKMATSDTTFKNTRFVRYIDTPATYATNGFVDPWGYTYGMMLGYDYQMTMTLPAPLRINGVDPLVINSSVAVWSRGMTPGDFDANENAKKYIVSWKEGPFNNAR